MARYDTVSIVLHWSVALLIFCAFPLGLYMTELPISPRKLQYYSWHKWAGVTIFLLVLIRLLWRAAHRPPVPVPMPRWQLLASESVHRLLYVFMVAVPLSGWLMSSAKGFQTVWFGVLPIPDLLSKDEALGKILAKVHELLNFGMLALVGVHVGAALKHQLIDRDGLMSRMSFFAGRQK